MGCIGKVVTFLLLALWLPVTQHCALEAAGFEIAAHAETQHKTNCLVSCDCDGCSTVEDGAYRPSDTFVKVPAMDACTCLLCLQILLPAPANEPVFQDRARFTRPLDWVTQWSFARRTAPPSRAPTLSRA